MHCPIIKVENREYWVSKYDVLIVAKRGDEIIPLNDFCLFDQVDEGLKSKFLELPKAINKSLGIVRYNGTLTKRYNTKGRFDNVELHPGDEVVFRLPYECLLEDPQHRKFEDCDIRYEHRYNIQAIKRHE